VSPVKYEMGIYIPEDDILQVIAVKTSGLTGSHKLFTNEAKRSSSSNNFIDIYRLPDERKYFYVQEIIVSNVK
jgi:hypothetical protein